MISDDFELKLVLKVSTLIQVARFVGGVQLVRIVEDRDK
jgi:hypothetical protein